MPKPPSKLLVPIEDATLAAPALSRAAELAAVWKSEVLLLHVWEPLPFTPPEASFMDQGHVLGYQQAAEHHASQILEAASKIAKEHGLEISGSLIQCGDPAETIVQAAADNGIGLIVIATHQRHGPSRWFLGSVAEKVAAQSHCPVLSVPSHPHR